MFVGFIRKSSLDQCRIHFANNVQVDGQPAQNNTTVTGKEPIINFSVDWEREYDKKDYLLFGVKVEHIKTDGTVENYYMSQHRTIGLGAGTSGTVGSERSTRFRWIWHADWSSSLRGATGRV